MHGERVVERGRLLDRPGKAVEHVTLDRIARGCAVEHHAYRDLVGHQLSPVHVRLGQHSDLGPSAEVHTEQVAGGNVRYPLALGDDGCLGAFAGARGSQ